MCCFLLGSIFDPSLTHNCHKKKRPLKVEISNIFLAFTSKYYCCEKANAHLNGHSKVRTFNYISFWLWICPSSFEIINLKNSVLKWILDCEYKTSLEENIQKFLSRFYPEEAQKRIEELLEVIEMKAEYFRNHVVSWMDPKKIQVYHL